RSSSSRLTRKASARLTPLTDQLAGVVDLADTSTPGRTLQEPARRSSPNQATTSLTLSTAGAMDCSRSSASTTSVESASAFRSEPGARNGDDAGGIGGGQSTDPSCPPSFVA